MAQTQLCLCKIRPKALCLPADHVIAASVLLDGGLAFGTLFRVGRDPIRGLGVVVAFAGPLSDQ